MAVGRYDDDLRNNQKLIAAGDRAAWLWFCGVMYCRAALTDGFIPSVAVPTLFPGAVQPKRSAVALVRSGLWSEVAGGYQVHDYLDWNPSKAEVEKYRSEERARKKRPRGIQPPSALETVPESVKESDTASETRAGALSAPLRSAVVGSSGSGSGSSEGSLRETALIPKPLEAFVVGNPHSRPGNLVNGSENRIHGQHAWCSWPARDGLCVPAFLHREFVGKLGGLPGAEIEMRAWYPCIVGKYEGVPVGDDVIDFWRNEFREWVGTVTTKASGRSDNATAHSINAAREYLRGAK